MKKILKHFFSDPNLCVGELDYVHLKGDTGPLVYPGGFVYLYSLFYYITGYGEYIKLAQYIFVVLQVAFVRLLGIEKILRNL